MAKRRTRRRRPAFPVQLVQRTIWRDARGRMVPAPRRGQRFPKGRRPKPDRFTVQLDTRGKTLRTVEHLTRTRVLKTSVAGTRGSVDIPSRETERGMIDPALAATNVYTQLRGARRIAMTLTGRDTKTGRPVKISTTISAETRGFTRRTENAMVWMLLRSMREKGYRTQYRLEEVDWTRVDTSQKDARGHRVNSKSAIRSRTPLANVEIQIVIDK